MFDWIDMYSSFCVFKRRRRNELVRRKEKKHRHMKTKSRGMICLDSGKKKEKGTTTNHRANSRIAPFIFSRCSRHLWDSTIIDYLESLNFHSFLHHIHIQMSCWHSFPNIRTISKEKNPETTWTQDHGKPNGKSVTVPPLYAC